MIRQSKTILPVRIMRTANVGQLRKTAGRIVAQKLHDPQHGRPQNTQSQHARHDNIFGNVLLGEMQTDKLSEFFLRFTNRNRHATLP